MKEPFRWNAHNIGHIGVHGVEAEDVEYVLRVARSPFPRVIGDGKHLIWGQTAGGQFLQVIFIFSPPGVIYVVHARPMTDREKWRFRRPRR